MVQQSMVELLLFASAQQQQQWSEVPKFISQTTNVRSHDDRDNVLARTYSDWPFFQGTLRRKAKNPWSDDDDVVHIYTVGREVTFR